MSKLLKPLIIVLFLLSIGALVLGTMLYQKREIVKGRTQKLEEAVATVARNLEYTGLSRDSLKNLDAMGSQLSAVATQAKETQNNLAATTESLEQAKQALEQSESALETTRSDLQASTDKATELEEEVATKQSDINRKQSQITSLQTERDELNEQLGQLETARAEAEANLADLQAEYDGLIGDYEKLVRATPNQGEAIAGPTMDPNFSAEVLMVNPEWNFVILDKGAEDELAESAVLLVHRGLEPIGKVRVRRVAEKVSLAEILSAWDSDTSVSAGDQVISSKS